MLNKLRLFQFGYRFLKLKLMNVMVLNNRIEFNGLIMLGSDVKIIIERGAKLVFKGKCVLKPGTVVFVKKKAVLIFGANTSTGHDTEISVGHRVEIGDDVIMGAYTYVTDSNHRANVPNLKIREQGMEIGTVKIGNDVWIGRGAMILKDAEIGNRSVVAAGSIVTKSFNPGVIIGGVPGKVVKELI